VRKDKATQSVERVLKMFSNIGEVVIVAMMIMIVMEVVLRFFFYRNVKGAMELCAMMLAVAAAFGMGWCAYTEAHINVNLISSLISKKKDLFLDNLNLIVGTVFSVVLIIYTYRFGVFIMNMGMVSDRLNIPLYPFVFATTAGFVLIALATTTLLVNCFKNYGKSETEEMDEDKEAGAVSENV